MARRAGFFGPRGAWLLGTVVGWVVLSGCSRGERQYVGTPWETITIRFKDKSPPVELRVEVACDDDSRQHGLKQRTKETLADNQGMLFLFPETRELSFWMEDTPLPLSIAFLDDEGKIEQIEDMKPMDRNRTRSKKALRYALEVNQGWFQRNGIAVGDSIADFRSSIGRFLVR